MTIAAATVPHWVQPPKQSRRCTNLLEGLADGTWTPSEDEFWHATDKAAKRARLHEWEWNNLIVPAWTRLAAARPDCPWPVIRLPHCPDQVLLPTDDSWKGRRIEGFCLCPEPDAERWSEFFHRVHWIARGGALMYCHCGPGQEPPGSGLWGGINDSGYVCKTCVPLLPASGRDSEALSSHRLRCDCRCCYCGEVAKEWLGLRLYEHPATAT